MDVTQANSTSCPTCGLYHTFTVCPRIKAVETYPDGTIKRIEYYTHQEAFPWTAAKPSN